MNNSWYKNGLRFECQRCGYCCTFEGGSVWVDIEEIKKIAEYLKLDINDFGAKYLRKIKDKYSLIEKPNHECIMYENGRCKIYAVRPLQCKTFPFWPEILKDKDFWDAMAENCKGIGKGPIYKPTL